MFSSTCPETSSPSSSLTKQYINLKNKLRTKDIREIYNNIPHLFEIIDDSELYDGAMNEFVKYDSQISFFDAMYIHIMNEKNISGIVRFDSDFDRVNGIIRLH